MTHYTFKIRHKLGDTHAAQIWPSLHTKARRCRRTRRSAFRAAYAIAYDALSSGLLDTQHAHDVVTLLHSAHDAGELSRDGQLFEFGAYLFVITITRSATPRRSTIRPSSP